MFSMRKIALLGLRGRKKQTLLTISAISLAIAFIVTILNMQDSITKTEQEQRKDIYGEWQGAVYNINDDILEQLSSNLIIDQYGKSVIYAAISNDKGGVVGNLGTMDANTLSLGRITLAEGSLPSNSHEVALEKSLLDALGMPYNVGEEITLHVQEMDKTTYNVTTSDKTFVLSGVINNFTDLWKGSNNDMVSAVVSSDYSNNEQNVLKNNVYFTVKPDFINKLDALELLLYTQGNYVVNDYTYLYLNAEYSNLDVKFFNNSIVFIVILITTIFVIFNIFSVLFQKRKKSFHILRTIGAKKHSIILLAFYEIFYSIVIAFPLGLILGLILSFCSFFLFKYLGITTVIAFKNPFNYIIPLAVILFSLIIGVAAPLIALLKSTLTAKEKMKLPKLNRSNKHLKKQTIINRIHQPIFFKRITTILLPILSFVIIMIALSNCFIKYIEGLPNKYYDSDYEYGSFTIYFEPKFSMTEEELDKIKNTFGVESVNAFRISKYYPIQLNNNQKSSEYEQLTTKYIFSKYANYNQLASTVFGIDPESEAFSFYKSQIQLGTIDYKKFISGEEVILYLPIYLISDKGELTESDENTENNFKESTIAIGDTITIHGENSDATVIVGGIIYTFASENIKAHLNKPYSIISSYALNEKLNIPNTEPTYQYVQVKANKYANYFRTDKELSAISSELRLLNYREENERAQNDARVKLILYATLTITVFFLSCMLQLNSYYVSFDRVKSKIGILWAIGFEKKQYMTITIKNNSFISLVSILCGIITGILYLYIQNYISVCAEYFNWKALFIIIGVIVVFFVTNLLMVYVSCRKIFKDNISNFEKN